MLSQEPLLDHAISSCIGHRSDITLWINCHSSSVGAIILMYRQQWPRLHEISRPWLILGLYGRKGWSKLVCTLRYIAQCHWPRHLWISWFFGILKKSRAQKFQNRNGTLRIFFYPYQTGTFVQSLVVFFPIAGVLAGGGLAYSYAINTWSFYTHEYTYSSEKAVFFTLLFMRLTLFIHCGLELKM